MQFFRKNYTSKNINYNNLRIGQKPSALTGNRSTDVRARARPFFRNAVRCTRHQLTKSTHPTFTRLNSSKFILCVCSGGSAAALVLRSRARTLVFLTCDNSRIRRWFLFVRSSSWRLAVLWFFDRFVNLFSLWKLIEMGFR